MRDSDRAQNSASYKAAADVEVETTESHSQSQTVSQIQFQTRFDIDPLPVTSINVLCVFLYLSIVNRIYIYEMSTRKYILK